MVLYTPPPTAPDQSPSGSMGDRLAQANLLPPDVFAISDAYWKRLPQPGVWVSAIPWYPGEVFDDAAYLLLTCPLSLRKTPMGWSLFCDGTRATIEVDTEPALATALCELALAYKTGGDTQGYSREA